MSGIAGIFYLDGRSVDKKDLERIIDNAVIADRGYDARGIWSNGPIGLAQRAFWTTPEQKFEVQPLIDNEAGLTLVMDGRVDNRSDLIADLKAYGINKPLVTDADIVLHAYQVWKEDCALKIIGDFAFAIWDSNKEQLFCARDALGIRPFYYYKCETFIAFASDALALFELPSVPKYPDLDSMALYLFNNFENTEHTEFKNILKLRPAHCIITSSRSFKIKQYWDINPDYFLELNSINEYAEAFLEVFTTAVTAQMRSISPVSVMFSGGLDSSSVLCLIEDLKSKGKFSGDISAYSVAFDAEPANETAFMKSVQEKWGTKIHWLSAEPAYPLWEAPEAINSSQAMWNAEAPRLTKLAYETAANDGVRVILSGQGGDEFLDTSIYLASDLFMTGHPIQALKFINSFSQYQTAPISLVMQLVFGAPLELLRAFLPKWFKKLYRTIRPIKTYDWICEPYYSDVFEKLRQKPWYLQNRSFKTISRRETYSSIQSGFRICGFELLDRLAASTGTIEARHPFCDRRLVELACSIPEKLLVHNWEPKGLLRTAMSFALPEKITKRMDKAEFTSILNNLLIYSNKEAAKDLLSTSYLDQIGLIDKKKAIIAYEEFCINYSKNLNNSRGSDIMWQLLSLEYWAKNTFGKIETSGGRKYEKRKVTT